MDLLDTEIEICALIERGLTNPEIVAYFRRRDRSSAEPVTDPARNA